MGMAERIKQETSLRAEVERDGGAWDMAKSSVSRGDWWRPCPFHGERTPSFHVVEPSGVGGFFKCFACDARGSIIDYVMLRDNLDATGAIRRLADAAGIARDEDPAATAARRAAQDQRRVRTQAEERAEAERRARRAKAFWRAAQPHAAPVRDYLAARGVNVDALRPSILSMRPASAPRRMLAPPCWVSSDVARLWGFIRRGFRPMAAPDGLTRARLKKNGLA